jgi:hypothetical protein
MPSEHDLLQAKQILSASLLRAGVRGGVIGMAAAIAVDRLIANAGKNVHAVGIGRKVVDGATAKERCVRVYVVQKIAESLLPPIYRIPKEIDGVPTDVIEAPPAFLTAKKKKKSKPAAAAASAAVSACSVNRRLEQRPVIAGISAGHFQVTSGTIGYFCRSTKHGDNPGDVFLLSNNHVFANLNQAQAGDDLYQPGSLDGGASAHGVADLTRFVTLHLGGVKPNRVDAAIGKLRPAVAHTAHLCSIGAITGVAAVAEESLVRKHGRTTGFTEGKITDASYDSLVGMDHENPDIVALFQDQLRIERVDPFVAFARGGDSGSLVVAKDAPVAVGLYFAGPEGGEYGIANKIQNVLNELEVQLL